jgi:hypothetical protein
MLAITAKLVRNRLRDLSTKLAELHDLPNPFGRFAEIKQTLHDHFQMIEEIGCEDPSIVAAWKLAKQYAQATWPSVSDQAVLRVDAMIGYWEGIGEDSLGIAIELVLREGTITKSSLGPFVAASYRELEDEERTIRWPDVFARVCSMLADLEFGTGNIEQGDALGEQPGEKITHTPAADPERQRQKNLDWLKTRTDAQRLALFKMSEEGLTPDDIDRQNTRKATYKGKEAKPRLWKDKDASETLDAASRRGIVVGRQDGKNLRKITHEDYLEAVRPKS